MVKIGLPEKLLEYLDENGEFDTYEFATLFNEDHQMVVGAVKCLQALDGIITAEPTSFVKWVLSEEGKQVVQAGSHEALAYAAIPPEGISKDDLLKIVPQTIHSIGLSKAMAQGWIMVDKSSGKPILRRKVENITDTVKEQLILFASDPNCIDAKVRNEYKKRKLIHEVTTRCFKLAKGVNFSLSITKPQTDLTPEMIASGSWKNLTFKPYNFNTRGVPPACGALHPLLKVREEFRQIFLEMGFTEMPTNNYVESSFWNFDALFQPQQHPARDAHDTFFVAEPKECKTFPMSYLEKVKQVHSSGGFGSQGYGYDWKIEEAQKNLLRTHTTAVSAKMLYKLAQDGFHPAKYFSIDRVFRNETLDATHLAEFHQVEGVVADYKLSLGDLIGVLSEFFSKLGLSKLTFKPAYNPYTEPSMEIFSFHPGLNKYIEVGNSGVFRPEMLLPMGLPKDVNVIAWGLSLERPTMIKYGINNIRTLVGPKVDLEMVHGSPICRLDKVHHNNSAAMANLSDHIDKITHSLRQLCCEIDEISKAVSVLQVKSVQSSSPEAQEVTVVPNLQMKHDQALSCEEQEVMAVPTLKKKTVKLTSCEMLEVNALPALQINVKPFSSCELKEVTPVPALKRNSAKPFSSKVQEVAAVPALQKEKVKPFPDINIIAHPERMPFALMIVLKKLSYHVNVSIYIESTLWIRPSDHETFEQLNILMKSMIENAPNRKKLKVHFLWQIEQEVPVLRCSATTDLKGEANIARYLTHVYEIVSKDRVLYNKNDVTMACKIDYWLDILFRSVVYGDSDKKSTCMAFKKFESALTKSLWLDQQEQPTLADLCWWSCLKCFTKRQLPTSLYEWVQKCNDHELFSLLKK